MSWNDVENNSNGDGGDKIDYTKFETGKTTVIRILDEEPVSKWRHWIQSANRSITCLGRGCPVCESIKASKDAGIKSSFSSTKRHTIHVLNKTTGKVELLEQGKTFFDQLLMYKNNIGDLRDFDMKVLRSGKDKNDTTYTFIPMAPSGLTKEEYEAYEANKVDIEATLAPYTVEQTLGFMQGKSAEEIFKKDDVVVVNEDIEIE